ncbi:MAG: carboxypeptidase-like regulatory domain-containing protein, partial [Candidatus Neomarinimicrobiota bacterium]
MIRHNSYSRNIFIAILVIILITCGVFAGTTGKIAGIVKDQETGQPLPGANVMLENTTRGASTDNNGYFYILNVQPGRYSLRSSVIGYEIMTVSDIRVQADLTSTVNFELNSTVLEGEEVIVTAERLAVELDVTGSQNIMDIGYLDRAPIADLRGAISKQTGIQNTGTTSFIRGGTSTELNVVMDGTSLNSGIIGDNYQGMNVTAI